MLIASKADMGRHKPAPCMCTCRQHASAEFSVSLSLSCRHTPQSDPVQVATICDRQPSDLADKGCLAGQVKAEEPVEDAEWEKPAPSTSKGGSKSTKAAAPKADGLNDIHDWPGAQACSAGSILACRELCVLAMFSLAESRKLLKGRVGRCAGLEGPSVSSLSDVMHDRSLQT